MGKHTQIKKKENNTGKEEKKKVDTKQVKEGMEEMGALRAITIDAAKISGVENRVGSLKVGKDADIVICNGNPLELATSVLITIINGKIVWTKERE